ncbi:MAG: DoxX family protein [Chlamydiales bacterium]|nr:DoxX family protein [Chlamydiales bacterium]
MDGKVEGGWLKHLYYGIVQGENFLGNFLLLIVRLYWGTLLVLAGLGKLVNAGGVADFFASLNIPAPLFMAYFIGLIELLGGASLFLGLFSRLFSILLVCVFIGAYATAHQEALINFFAAPNLFINEAPFLFLYASLIVLCFGPGFVSIDYWIEKKAYGNAL